MQKEIDDRLARALLAGEVRDGDTVIVALAPDGETLTVARADTAPASAGSADATAGDDVIDAEIVE
jgi:ATP-dependent Clp protease ATP-binding subunit ClpB